MQSFHVPSSHTHSARLSVGWAWFICTILATLLNNLPGIVVFPHLMDRFGFQLFDEYKWVLYDYYGFISFFHALMFTVILWGGLRYFAQFRFGSWRQWFVINFSTQALLHIFWTLGNTVSNSNRLVAIMVITFCTTTWLSYWQQVLLRPVANRQQRRLWMIVYIVTSVFVAVISYMISNAIVDANPGASNLSNIIMATDILISLIYVIPTAFVLNHIARLSAQKLPFPLRESQ